MNVFWLSNDLDKCAQYHCDKHVNKMLIESVQLLCTALYRHGVENLPYKPTHANHPCTLWASDSNGNFKRLCLLATKLSNEYTYRYGRRHKTADALTEVLKLTNMNAELPFGDAPALRPPLCMPVEELGIEPWEPVVDAYRTYYQHKYDHGMTMRWTGRDVPEWMNLNEELV